MISIIILIIIGVLWTLQVIVYELHVKHLNRRIRTVEMLNKSASEELSQFRQRFYRSKQTTRIMEE